MALTSGTKLGPYEIQSPLGAGGMGEVYRARDTRLDREVAIKVLPAHLSSDTALKQRLDREAKAISKLSHPHICTLHDIGHQDGVDFLVMEYLEGETLEQRLLKGPLPAEQTLRYAAEVADGLAKAHKLGITHRDLKPANVMLTKSGAKLMDFGLAKEAGPAPLAEAHTEMTMEQAKLTSAGMIVGTFQYMAPEQLEGKEADARTDIFALGEVIYEMATGKPAFNGKSRASLIAAILTTEPPPISQLQPLTPSTLERVVQKCLAKDPDDRWQSASDLASELQWVATASQSASAPAVAVGASQRAFIPWLVAALALAIAAVAAGRVYFQPSPASTPRARFVIVPPEKISIRASGQEGGSVVLSPDGQRVAFVGVDASGKRQVWVRPLDQLNATPVPGTEGGYFPFWSPDGASLGFFSDRQLKRVTLDSGRVVPICEVHIGRGGTWNKQGVIVFSPDVIKPLYQVPAAGGTPVVITQLDRSHHSTHRWPSFLPDGQHFLYFAGGHDDISHTHDGIYVGSFDGKASKFLIKAHSNAAYADGHLFFINDSALMAQPFDPSRMELTGEASVVQEGVEEDSGFWLGVFSVSQTGVLAYAPTNPNSGNRLTWFDRGGKQLGVVGDLGRYSSLSLSPDGRRVIVEHAQPHHELWIYDVERNTKSQFTFGESANAVPVWSPDGKSIAFASDRNGHVDLYIKSVLGSDSEKLLLQSSDNKYPTDWTSDGKFLLYQEFASEEGNGSRLGLVATSGQEAPRILAQSPFYTSDGSISLDGRWIAYTSQEQGANQVFVMPFSGTGPKRQVSSLGGSRAPMWRKDGKAIIYSTDDGNLLEAEVSARNSELSVGASRILFRGSPELVPQAGRTFDIAPNGRFMVDVRSQENVAQIVVISNWTAGLKN
jgi:eukaryotic-like serine/threonine-protein kinase